MDMKSKKEQIKNFIGFSNKIIVVHTLTYFLFGMAMSNLFNYKELFEQEIIRDFMKPIDSPYVMFGPFLQPIRGILFAIALWPLRNIIIESQFGWLILWNIFIVFGIVSTPAAAPCSIEGIIYSKLPPWYHLIGLPEILLQTLTLSLTVSLWIKKPAKETIGKPMSRRKKIFLRMMFAIMIGCFGYIGYAIGGIICATIAGVKIDLHGESVTIKSQLMFVVAFVVNVCAVVTIASKRFLGRISRWYIFIIFWLLDTLVPIVYQLIFTRVMPLHLALILGFFPALVIIFSIKMNHKNFSTINNSELIMEENHLSD